MDQRVRHLLFERNARRGVRWWKCLRASWAAPRRVFIRIIPGSSRRSRLIRSGCIWRTDSTNSRNCSDSTDPSHPPDSCDSLDSAHPVDSFARMGTGMGGIHQRLTSPPMDNPGEILLYQTEDGRSRIDVRLVNETVW